MALLLLARLVVAVVIEPRLNSTFLVADDFESFHLSTWAVDFGAVDDEPLMHPKYEWDEEIGGKGTILVDPIDRIYKAWYISQPGIDYTTYNSSEGAARMISYATSTDGVHWERPLLDVVPWEGKLSNLLLRLPDDHECSYANVFVDPHAVNKSRRYEMLALLSVEPPGFPKDNGHAIYRYYSADGIHWTPDAALVNGPCAGGKWCSDSMYINKREDGSYLALLKHGPPSGAGPGQLVPYDTVAGGTRWIYVSRSTDGNEWEPASLALSPDWRDGQDFQVISSISTIKSRSDPIRRPGGPLLIGWLPVFHTLSQTIDMQFAVSADDGTTWWRPERRSAVQFKELGYWGGGMMWPFRLFVPDRDEPGKLHGYFSGCQGRHADIHSTLPAERFAQARAHFGWNSYGGWGYKELELRPMESYAPVRGTNWFRGALMRATWDSRRLWALVPSAGGDVPGQARTAAQDGVMGKRLVVNIKVHNQTRTKQMGSLSAELLDKDSLAPIAGFTLADSIPLSPADGSTYDGVVAWKGGEECPADGVKVRFVLLRARLYSFDWV